ncbi:hypothetical protein [Sutcliffiella deserti]|uniref:hypothetical protein n=1 Tax=Sutcliffiella deserti TaxID=2875501 RepID=UPI001CBB564B|nr:hypothetical protein [Sutcliffiella deserti]
MKKYWKSLAIIVGIVLSITTFYVNSARSAEHYPEFIIETQSGDEQVMDSLVLEGSYSNTSSMSYVSTNLRITTEGSTYNSRSFLDQIIGYHPTYIKELQQDYRTFMRGKFPSSSLYYEDNEFLAYANVEYTFGTFGPDDFKFEIAVLNKEDNKTNSFALEVPGAVELDHIFVEDVQLIDNKLYLITQNMVRKNDDYHDKKHIYEIDIVNQEIITHEDIYTFAKWQEHTHSYVRLVESNPSAANENIIFLKTEETMVEEPESTRVTDFKQEIILYNLVTKEKESINVPGLDLKENQLSYVDKSIIYFTRLEEQELVVTPYRLDDKQTGQEVRIYLELDQIPMIQIKDGKLYAAPHQITSNSVGDVAVIDAKTGETLSTGQITLKNASDEKGNFELYVHEIFMK